MLQVTSYATLHSSHFQKCQAVFGQISFQNNYIRLFCFAKTLISLFLQLIRPHFEDEGPR